MRSMVYKTISIVLMIAVGMIIMAAHHEKESDDLASLKEAHNLNWESWAAADMETHFSTVRPEGSGIFDNGYLSSMKMLTMTKRVTGLSRCMKRLIFRWTTRILIFKEI